MGSQLDAMKSMFDRFGIQYEEKKEDGGLMAIIVCNSALIFDTFGDYIHSEDGDTGAKIPKKI